MKKILMSIVFAILSYAGVQASTVEIISPISLAQINEKQDRAMFENMELESNATHAKKSLWQRFTTLFAAPDEDSAREKYQEEQMAKQQEAINLVALQVKSSVVALVSDLKKQISLLARLRCSFKKLTKTEQDIVVTYGLFKDSLKNAQRDLNIAANTSEFFLESAVDEAFDMYLVSSENHRLQAVFLYGLLELYVKLREENLVKDSIKKRLNNGEQIEYLFIENSKNITALNKDITRYIGYLSVIRSKPTKEVVLQILQAIRLMNAERNQLKEKDGRRALVSVPANLRRSVIDQSSKGE